MEDHVDGWHVTKNIHMEKDHVDRQHVIWNFNLKDHVDGQHVTRIIIVKDHGDRHHMTGTTAAQQQPEDLRPAGELNLTNK